MSFGNRIAGPLDQPSSAAGVAIISRVRIHAEELAASLGEDLGLNTVRPVRLEDCSPAQLESLGLTVIVVDSSSVQPTDLAQVFGQSDSVAAARVALKLIAYGLADGDEETVLDFAALGAQGFLFSDATFSELRETLRSVLVGQVRCPRKITVSLLRYFATSVQLRTRFQVLAALTPRQRQALVLRLAGNSNKVVARHMGVEVGTVKREIHDAYKKLGVHGIGEAAHLLSSEGANR